MAVVSTVYILLLLDILPLPFVSDSIKWQILPTVSLVTGRFKSCADSPSNQLPWWALVTTGSYLLSQLGWGLFNFSDTPKAYEELMIVSDAAAFDLFELLMEVAWAQIGYQRSQRLPARKGSGRRFIDRFRSICLSTLLKIPR